MACVDTWEGSASNLGNTDGVLMVTLDVDAKRVMLTTFTREMLVKRPDGGIGRFTYIAKNYGPEALCETVSTHFGTKVDKYIIFSMDNVQTIIDAMGGVYITVTDAEAGLSSIATGIARDATTPSMDKAGTYLFTGHAAVIYMRIRKVGGDGDSGRTRRIRTVAEHTGGQVCPGFAGRCVAVDYHRIGKHRHHQHEHGRPAGSGGVCSGTAGRGAGRHSDAPGGGHANPITYAGMATRQVDFEYSRQVLSEFLESQSFDVVE